MGLRERISDLHYSRDVKGRILVGRFPLVALSLVYGALMRLRAYLYAAHIFKQKKIPALVVCVGNITTGGTGKTPVVIHIARRLFEAGVKTAVISRGYGYHVKGEYTVVSDPEKVRFKSGEGPDEAVMTAHSLPGVPVVVSPDRVAAGRAAVELFGARVVVMDDGFQHMRLFRDIDILVVSAQNPVGNGFTLPAGPLREPLSAMRRADFLWVSGSRTLSGFAERWIPDVPVVKGRLEAVALVSRSGSPLPRGGLEKKRVAAFCGIARPERFLETVRNLGGALVDTVIFGDHHRFSDADVASLNRRARAADAEIFVTTQKDLARINPTREFSLDVVAPVMELIATGDAVIFDRIMKELETEAR